MKRLILLNEPTKLSSIILWYYNIIQNKIKKTPCKSRESSGYFNSAVEIPENGYLIFILFFLHTTITSYFFYCHDRNIANPAYRAHPFSCQLSYILPFKHVISFLKYRYSNISEIPKYVEVYQVLSHALRIFFQNTTTVVNWDKYQRI